MNTVQERDDINKLSLPRSAKRYARRHGLKSMLRQPKDYQHVVRDLTNQHFKNFPDRDVGVTSGKNSIKDNAQHVVSRLLDEI